MDLKAILSIMSQLGFFIMGLFQLAAIMAYTTDVLGLHWILGGPLAFILSYIPVIGAALGIYAAMSVWKWSVISSSLLFCWPLVCFAALLIIGKIQESKVVAKNKSRSISHKQDEERAA